MRPALVRLRLGVGVVGRIEVAAVLGAAVVDEGYRRPGPYAASDKLRPLGAAPGRPAPAPLLARRQTVAGPTQGHNATLAVRLLPRLSVGVAKADPLAPGPKGPTVP